MFSRGANQTELSHMASERSRSVMVLAVNVVCHRATQGDEFCAWCYGEEPSFRDEHMQNGGETNATLCSQDSRRWIEREEVIERRRFNDRVVVINAAIAIASSESIREDASLVLG